MVVSSNCGTHPLHPQEFGGIFANASPLQWKFPDRITMILVTGGAGYIGSHTCVALLAAGEDVVVFDNFSNSSPVAIERVRQISGKSVAVVEGDIRDQAALEKVLTQYGCTAVMHFAG